VCGAAALMADPDDPTAWLEHIAALENPATRNHGQCRPCPRATLHLGRGGAHLLDLLMACAA
jgi:hypothetical protein